MAWPGTPNELDTFLPAYVPPPKLPRHPGRLLWALGLLLIPVSLIPAGRTPAGAAASLGLVLVGMLARQGRRHTVLP